MFYLNPDKVYYIYVFILHTQIELLEAILYTLCGSGVVTQSEIHFIVISRPQCKCK